MSQLEVDKIIPQSGTTLTIGDSGDTVNFADGTALSIDTNTLYIDSTNNRVGIGTTSPGAKLEIQTGSDWGNIINSTYAGTQYLQQFEYNGTSIGKIRGDNSSISIESGSNLILQTANTERMRIDSSGNVGINQSAPGQKLDVQGIVQVKTANSGTRKYRITDSVTGQYFDMGVSISSSQPNLTFSDGADERMRIDSSGNLLVANTTASSADTGHIFSPSGIAFHTRDGGIPLVLNRLTSDGEILRIRKDNTEVGSIGTEGGDIAIGNADAGIQFVDGNEKFRPFNMSTNTSTDNLMDIGQSSKRFKDLYLGGGLYVGGTGTANKLDDYEEGTWTPTTNIGFNTIYDASYVKIGQLVFVNLSAQTNTGPQDVAQATSVGGLPFACRTGNAVSNSVIIEGLNQDVYAEISGSGYIQVDKDNGTQITRNEFGNQRVCRATLVYSIA